MQDIQGSDGVLEPDLPRVCIDVEDIGRLHMGDGIVHQVVGLLCVLVCGLYSGKDRWGWTLRVTFVSPG